jgi:hypothetical protein
MKILLFDTWTNGLMYFNPLVELFSDIEFEMLHLDSFFKKGEVIDNIATPSNLILKDLKDVGFEIDTYIKSKDFKCAIVLSLHSFQHRVFINTCNRNKLPVVFISHGARFYNKVVKNVKSNLFYYGKRFLFYSNLYLKLVKEPTQKGYLKKKDLLPLYYSLVLQYNKFKNHYNKYLPMDIDEALVNVNEDIEYYNKYWFPLKKPIYHVAGNMLTSFIALDVLKTDKTSISSVLFVSQPEVLSLKRLEKYLKVIRTYYENNKNEFNSLVYRPHPRDTEKQIELGRELNFEISDKSQVDDLSDAKVVFGINSALLYAAMMLQKQIFVYKDESVKQLPGLTEYEKKCYVNFPLGEIQFESFSQGNAIETENDSIDKDIQIHFKTILNKTINNYL